MYEQQKRNAKILLDLHAAPRLLVLPNVWNPIGARILERQGYPAVATASAAIAESLGFRDGEALQRSTMLEQVGRVAAAVQVPVTADMEGGYAESLADLDDTVTGVLDAGVVGINLEDGRNDGEVLRGVDEQCERIARVRQAAAGRGVHLVINARTDCFLSSTIPDKHDALEAAVERARAYVDAGADCIYPIGPGDEKTIRELVRRIPGPVNILASPKGPSLAELEALGVHRVSFGPFLFRALLRKFVDITAELGNGGGYFSLHSRLTGADVDAFLRPGPERDQ